MEALAQEHFNYIAEGGAAAAGPRSSPLSRLGRREGAEWWWARRLLSPRAAVSLVTLVATVVAARHLRNFLADLLREAFSPLSGGGEGGEAVRGGGGKVADTAVRVNR